MRKGKKYIDKLVDLQEKLRVELLVVYCTFDFARLDLCLSEEDKIITLLKEIQDLVKDSKDAVFFTHYRYLVTAAFQLIKWVKNTLGASPDAVALMQAAKVNASLIDLSAFPYATSFAASFSVVITKIIALDGNVLKVKEVFDELKKMPYPFLYEVEEDPYLNFRKNRISDEDTEATEIEETPIVSIEFLVDQEPWANPQILQPGKIYSLSGRIRVNAWPKGFDELVLHPISSVDQTNYILDLPIVKPFQEKTLNISGTVTFKYPQHKFDDNLSVRLLCYFQNAAGAKKIPLVIGYDQLIAKVLDPNSYEFMTGFASMSSALLDVATKISIDFPMVGRKERDDFLTLLRGILNYQGYCMQQGVYKNEANLAESTFRDRMIQHLIGLPYLGESIVKEAELAGGRVEISYNGIIAELKSESRIADRKQLVAKYGSQPVAYSSGNSKQLSILCILDLTEKIAPPAPPRNNIIIHSPEVHGHDAADLAFPPMQIVVIIDGNTKKPSDYSKN